MTYPTPSAYHADTTRISKSMLTTFGKSRREFEAQYITRTQPPKPASAAMELGTALHCKLLEPDAFDALIVEWPLEYTTPSGARSTAKAALEWQEAMRQAGKVIVSRAEMDALTCMAHNVRQAIGKVLDHPSLINEQPLQWQSPENDMLCRCKPDMLIEFEQAVWCIDLKTTADASARGFADSAVKFEYGLQWAHYSEGIQASYGGKPVDWWFVAVQSSWPFTCGIYSLDLPSQTKAAAVRLKRMEQMAACYDSGDWSEPWEAKGKPIELRVATYEAKGINENQEV